MPERTAVIINRIFSRCSFSACSFCCRSWSFRSASVFIRSCEFDG
nr:MAG TPA: hypothetical protein [Bacteriophage sp.]